MLKKIDSMIIFNIKKVIISQYIDEVIIGIMKQTPPDLNKLTP